MVRITDKSLHGAFKKVKGGELIKYQIRRHFFWRAEKKHWNRILETIGSPRRTVSKMKEFGSDTIFMSREACVIVKLVPRTRKDCIVRGRYDENENVNDQER